MHTPIHFSEKLARQDTPHEDTMDTELLYSMHAQGRLSSLFQNSSSRWHSACPEAEKETTEDTVKSLS